MEEMTLLAHELKTPIYSIYNAAELLAKANAMERLTSDKIAEYANQIKFFCNQLSLLSSNILTSAQEDTAFWNCKYEVSNLNDFINNFDAMLQKYASVLNFSVVTHLKNDTTAFCCDYEKLERILLNLVSNGVKFNNKKNKRITITVTENKRAICFEVKDNGIGIDGAFLPLLTKPFFRAEDFFTRQTQGTGLGLHVVDTLLRVLRGKLSIKSTVGKGTTAAISLPKAPVLPGIGEPHKYYMQSTNIYDVELASCLPYAWQTPKKGDG